MSEICPVCNGLYDRSIQCSNCGALMIQAGKLEDYNEPYSPYLENELFILNNETAITGDNCCIHLYSCPDCGHLEHGAIQILSI